MSFYFQNIPRWLTKACHEIASCTLIDNDSCITETIFYLYTYINNNRAAQNTDSALLEFPMRIAMHGKSRVSSAISVCDN